MPTLDQVLQFISVMTWAIFAVYAISTFMRVWGQRGLATALLYMLSVRVLFPLLAPIGVSILAAAVVVVSPTQVAVVASLISPNGIRPQPLLGGLHLIVPVLEKPYWYPIGLQTYTMSATPNEGQGAGDDSISARTSDGQEVQMDMSLIFRINSEQVVSLHIDWQDRYINDFIRPVIRGVVRTQVSQYKVREVNSSARKDLENTLERLLREDLGAKGLLVDQFLLRNIGFTPEYAAAVEQKQVAQEGEERTAYEAAQMRNLAEGTSDQLSIEAVGNSKRIELEADAQANATLLHAQAQAESLRIIGQALKENPALITYEYVQKLSPSIRTMLVPNDSPFILPLPEMDAPMSETESISTTVEADDTTEKSVEDEKNP